MGQALTALVKRWVLGLIELDDPAEIMEFETSGAVDRVHALPTSSLPLWMRLYFPATRFYDAGRDEWFVPFEPAGEVAISRRKWIVSCLYTGGAGGKPRYTGEDVERVAQLLKEGATDHMLGEATAGIINRLFTQQPLPHDVVDAAQDVLQDLGEAFQPGKYCSAKKSAKHLCEYAAGAIPGIFATTNACPIDLGHNLSAAAVALVAALRSLQQNTDKTLVEIFSAAPPTGRVPRIAVADRTVGKHRLRRGRDVIMYNLTAAAPQAMDPQLLFTFSVGLNVRVCAFREFFLAFLEDVRVKLKGPKGQ